MNSAEQKLAIARKKVLKRMPYLSSAVYLMVPKAVSGIKTTIITEDMVFLYDPETILNWSLEDVATAIAHEVGHVVRNHIKRASNIGVKSHSDSELWNYAADANINEDLRVAGFTLLDTDITYKKLGVTSKNLTTEQVFKILKDNKVQPKHQTCCGSGAGNKHEIENNIKSELSGIIRKKSEIENSRSQVAKDVQKHYAAGNNTPNSWLNWAEKTLKPATIPWQNKFSAVFRKVVEWKTGYIDYQYNGLSKRQPGLGYQPNTPILPRLCSPKLKVLVALDVSYSMLDKHGKALNEISEIIKVSGSEVDFVSLDVEVQSFGKVLDYSSLKKHLKGGGGTRFKPLLDYIQRMPDKPSVVVFFTDGETCENSHTLQFVHGVEFIWALVGKNSKAPVPWGRKIEIL